MVPGVPAADVDASDPFALATSALDQWAQLEGTGSAASAMSGLAAAGLDFAQHVTASDMPASEIIGAIVPLVEAQARAASEIVPGYEADAARQVEALQRAQAIVGKVEALDGDIELADALELAALASAPYPSKTPWQNAMATEREQVGASPWTFPSVEEQLARVAEIEATLDDAHTSDDPVALVRAALAMRPAPETRHALPEMPHFEGLRAAIEALYAWYDHEPTPEEVAALDAFEAVPTGTADAMTRIVEAYMFMAEANRIAFEGADVEALRGTGGAERATFAAAVDLGLLAAAQAIAAPVVVEAVGGLECSVPLEDDSSFFFQYDLGCMDSTYDKDTLLLIDLGGHDLYRNNAGGGLNGSAFLFDLSGNDVYISNRSGNWASTGGAVNGTGALLDLGGHDTYDAATSVMGQRTLHGTHGGAVSGAGLLVDSGGNDIYRTRLYGSSGVIVGVPDGVVTEFFPSFGNARIRTSAGATTGSGLAGVGALIDASGWDVHDARMTGGAVGGSGHTGGNGLLYDGGGDDRYDTQFFETSGGPLGRRFVDGVAHGSAEGGTGLLVDRRGNDSYEVSAEWCEHGCQVTIAANGASNSGYSGAPGRAELIDGCGDDVYRLIGRRTSDFYGVLGGSPMRSLAANGAAVGLSSLARLTDLAGDDSYMAFLDEGDLTAASARGVNVNASLNGAARGFESLGVIHDLAGNDTYEGGAFDAVLNGAGNLGIGILLDGDGHNRFVSVHGSRGARNGASTGLPVNVSVGEASTALGAGGLGILVGGDGGDTYSAGGISQGAAEFGGLGLLYDPGGRNSYDALDPGFAQGAGRTMGTGLLIDRGELSAFNLKSGAAGQATGLQGVGILVHAGPASFEADVQADPSDVTGAGVGLRIGLGDASGFEPVLSCRSLELLAQPFSVPGVVSGTANLCGPNEDTEEYVINPLTGRPLTVNSDQEGTIYKPSIPCGSISFPVNCGAVVGGLLGPKAVDWLGRGYVRATTSGSFTFITDNDAASAEQVVNGRTELASGDDSCDVWGCDLAALN